MPTASMEVGVFLLLFIVHKQGTHPWITEEFCLTCYRHYYLCRPLCKVGILV